MISIIIPFYFYDFHVENMIHSVLEQTYNDYEVIMVGNNIKEGRYHEIVDSITTSFKGTKKISFYYTEILNGNAARQYGLEKSNEKYVFFLDSDDLLPDREFLERISRILEEYTPDILSVNIQRGVYGDSGMILGEKVFKYKKPDSFLSISKDRYSILKNYGTNIAGRFIKRNLFQKIEFKEVPFFQDWNVSCKIFPYATTFYFLSDTGYIWIKRSNSISQFNSMDEETYHKAFDSLLDIVSFYEDNQLIKENKLFYCLRLIEFCFQYSNRGMMKQYPSGILESRQFLKQNLPFSIKLLYFPTRIIMLVIIYSRLMSKLYFRLKMQNHAVITDSQSLSH